MPFDKFIDFETISEERDKAIKKSIRTIGLDELKKLGEEIFPYPDDPWRTTLFRLIKERPHATYYQATAGDHVVFLYCLEEDLGLWFLRGSGVGPLSERGKQMVKDAIKQKR